ncbi:hypothetical protein CUU62_07715 [Pseudomonas sp. WP001]|nr:hypothetical protein CUU62_07715 [Pseudomonas sp. WP001]
MKILIKALAKKSQWEVRLDQRSIIFHTEAEARAFADTLQTRIQAPTAFHSASNAPPADRLFRPAPARPLPVAGAKSPSQSSPPAPRTG